MKVHLPDGSKSNLFHLLKHAVSTYDRGNIWPLALAGRVANPIPPWRGSKGTDGILQGCVRVKLLAGMAQCYVDLRTYMRCKMLRRPAGCRPGAPSSHLTGPGDFVWARRACVPNQSHFLCYFIEDFKSRLSVQIGCFKNRRNLLQGTKIVDWNQIFVGPELNINEFLLVPPWNQQRNHRFPPVPLEHHRETRQTKPSSSPEYHPCSQTY
jgi:hypothetical protein